MLIDPPAVAALRPLHRLLLPSPLGPLLLGHDGNAVVSLRYLTQGEHPPAGTRDLPARGDALGATAADELSAYFSGALRQFTVPLAPEGTPFQRAVWDALRRVPFGATRSYAALALEAGRPGAARAVGQANARNPLPILIPCHRVLAAGGAIGGYMGDWGSGRGVDIKRWLLTHEAGSPS